MSVKKEMEKTDNIEQFLKLKGWITQREVQPIECKNWEYPYRIDLIFYKNPQECIAVEFKDASLRSGGKIAKAFSQIQKYRTMNYEGLKIVKWCICPSFTSPINEYDEKNYGSMANVVIIDFIRKFFSFFDISYMWFEKDHIIIDAMTNHRIDIK